MRVFNGWLEFLKRQKAPAENSRVFRGAVLATVMLGLVCVSHQLEWPPYTFFAMAMTVLGYFYSYHRREHNNWAMKAVLSVVMVLILARFLTSLPRHLSDPRIPLAELLVWLQTAHSWDVPARKDLGYSMMVALILIAISAVLTYQNLFFLYLVVFAVGALLCLFLSYRSQITEVTGQTFQSSQLAPEGRPLLAGGWRLCLLAVLVFLVLPRAQGLKLRALPMSWDLQFRLTDVSDGEVVNPSYPNGLRDKDGNRAAFSADSYHGFNSVVDLNMRGRLNDSVVLKVRSSHWLYHRGLTFDVYHGDHWTQAERELQVVDDEKPPYFVPGTTIYPRERVAIYYVERPLPNVIFTPLHPSALYFPSQEIFLGRAVDRETTVHDYTAGIRAPFALEGGMVYSVVARDWPAPPSRLTRLQAKDRRTPFYDEYLQLPDSTPTRVRELAKELTDAYGLPWQKAQAIGLYLQREYEYNLDTPAYPAGADVADYFLFEARSGYCEQFATTMVVLCRAAGIRARYVNGYLPGTFNPVTGFYEIRGTDAHAWVEVYVPNYGWAPFDPVPGEALTPELEQPTSERWMLLSLLKFLKARTGAGEWVGWALVGGLALMAFLGLASLLRPRTGASNEPQGVRAVFAEAERWLAPRGVVRRAGQTPSDFAAEHPSLRELVGLLERSYYGGESGLEADARRAFAGLKESMAGNEESRTEP